MKDIDVIVIGAGAAGLLAAGRAAECGGKVLVLEKMRQPGRKLLITGKGRCNITNSAPVSEFIKHIYPNGKFLRNAFSQFFSKDIISLLQNFGTEVTLERGGRYFPAGNKSADVLTALQTWIDGLNVEIRCGEKVEKIVVKDAQVEGVVSNGKTIAAKTVILATGGKSYPATGSSGDGYELAKTLGHTVVSPRPALVPLETEGDLAQRMAGLTLKNVNASVWINGKKKAENFGELTFMEFGLSGPIVLTLSRIVVNELQKNNRVEIAIDLKPALDEQKLDNRLIRDLNENGKKKLRNIFDNWLPKAMIPAFIELTGINTDNECHQVSSAERKKIRHLLKNLRFKITGYRSFKEAIVTAGGVRVNEIYPKTMESKRISGLFFAGEVLDLDADTGGYNLQIAFSTGWVAGNSCMRLTV